MTNLEKKMNARRRSQLGDFSLRGKRTRQKIIDTLFSLLENRPLREITVAMIARKLGVSSQLFYNYFSSIDQVIEEEAIHLLASRPPLVELVDCEWTDQNALARAVEIVEQSLEYWNRHRAAMKVITLLGDSGHPSFVSFREERAHEFASAIARLARRQIENGRLPGSISPELLGWSTVSSLQATGLNYTATIRHHSHEEIVRTRAFLIASGLGFRPSCDTSD